MHDLRQFNFTEDLISHKTPMKPSYVCFSPKFPIPIWSLPLFDHLAHVHLKFRYEADTFFSSWLLNASRLPPLLRRSLLPQPLQISIFLSNVRFFSISSLLDPLGSAKEGAADFVIDKYYSWFWLKHLSNSFIYIFFIFLIIFNFIYIFYS